MVDGYGHFTSGPVEAPLPAVADLRRMQPVEQASLAGRSDLSTELVDALVACQDDLVATALAMNQETTPAVLQTLAEQHPSLAAWVARNPNAPASVKDPVPLRDHTAYSLQLYLDEHGASDQERAALDAEHAKLPPAGGPPLREAWHRVQADLRG